MFAGNRAFLVRAEGGAVAILVCVGTPGLAGLAAGTASRLWVAVCLVRVDWRVLVLFPYGDAPIFLLKAVLLLTWPGGTFPEALPNLVAEELGVIFFGFRPVCEA